MDIKNASVYTPDHGFVKQDLKTSGDFISTSSSDGHNIDAEGLYAIPGLTDIHLHGCMGYDFCDGTPAALDAISTYLAENGITTFTPASMTFPEDKLAGIFENARTHSSDRGATLMGINMEGPFLAASKKGAQNGTFLEAPDAEMFRRLNTLSGNLIRLVTLAPELPGASDFIAALKDEVVIALGHSAADYDTASEAFAQGARHVTHLYNAMRPFGHRDPGLIGAASDVSTVTAELICDGVHSHPAAVRAAFKLFPGRLALISDSMMATGLEDGTYALGGQAVTVNGTHATLADGTLAGSVTNLMDCMRHAVDFGIPLEAAVHAAAVTPAKVIGAYDRIGSLDIGKLANIVLLDSKLQIQGIILRGRKIL